MPLYHIIVCLHGALLLLLPLKTKAQSMPPVLECLVTINMTDEHIDQITDSEIEYHLYRSQPSGLTWCESYRFCQYQGQSLGLLDTKRIQEYITRLNMADDRRVWMGGRRKDYGSEWTWINDLLTDASGNLTIYDANIISKDCGRISLTRSGIKEITADVCDLPKPFICFSAGKDIAGTLSWKNAMNYCADKGSRLATLEEITAEPDGNTYWFGLKRRPWIWIYQDISVRPVLYSSWLSESGGDCIALLPNGSWTATPCTERLQYVLCQEELHPETESTSTTSTASTGSEQPKANTSSYYRRVITAQSVIIVVLAIIIIVGAVLLVTRIKYKRKGNANPNRAAIASGADNVNTISEITADRHGESNELNVGATTEYEPVGEVATPRQLPPSTEGQGNESEASRTAEYEQIRARDPIRHTYAPFTNPHPYQNVENVVKNEMM